MRLMIWGFNGLGVKVKTGHLTIGLRYKAQRGGGSGTSPGGRASSSRRSTVRHEFSMRPKRVVSLLVLTWVIASGKGGDAALIVLGWLG